MRIYEIAREAGVTSVEVLKAAEAAGVEASNAISSVDADEAAALKAAVSKEAGGARVAKRADKRNLAAELNAKFFAEQRAKLERHPPRASPRRSSPPSPRPQNQLPPRSLPPRLPRRRRLQLPRSPRSAWPLATSRRRSLP